MTRRLLLLALLSCVPPVASAQRIRLPASLSDLEQRALQDSNDAAAHYNVALAYINAKRYDDADHALHQAVAIEPKFAPAWLALAQLPFLRRPSLREDVYLGNVPAEWRAPLREAYTHYQHAFLIDPLVDLRIEAMSKPARSAFWASSEEAEEIYNYFFRYLDDILEGKYEGAYNRLNQLYDAIPTQRERDGLPGFIFYYRGLSAAHIGRFTEALQDFNRLLRRAEEHFNPDSLVHYIPLELNEYRYMIAVLNQRAGDPNEAIRLFRQVLEEDAGYYMAHAQLANIYESAQRMEQAIAERRYAVNANPEDASLLLDLALTLAKAGKAADAEEPLRQAQAANPRDARASYYLGIVEQQLGKKDDARAALTRFVAIAPSRYDRQIADAQQRLATLQ